MATHSSVLAWRIPGMGEPGELPSMGSHRVRHDWSDLAAAAAAALCGCHNQVSQTEWLRTTQICCLTDVKARVWNQGISRPTFPMKLEEEILFLAYLYFQIICWESLVLLTCRHNTPVLCLYMAISFLWMSVQISSLHKNINDICLESTLRTLLSRISLQIRSHPEVLGVRTSAGRF